MTIRTREDVAAHVEAAVHFGAPGVVGAELEWLVVDRADAFTRPDLDRVAAALPAAGPLPGGSVLSTEPGGQVELSSAPQAGPAAAVRVLAADVEIVRLRLSAAGIAMTGMGADPCRPPVRLVDSPRYDVMEAFYARMGQPCTGAGRAMMCSSAAVQVSLDAGTTGAGVQSAGSGGSAPMRSVRRWSPPSPARRCWKALPPAGSRRGSGSGPTSTPHVPVRRGLTSDRSRR